MGLFIGVGSTRPTNAYDYYYGVEFDTTVAATAFTRLGRPELHVSLPIQSKMRRCILRDNGTVAYYLGETDSTKTSTGGTADLTGATGQVMVEIPKHYRRFETEGNKRRVYLSEYPLPGFTEVPVMYISAYEAAVDRTVSATPKLCSVVNLAPEFRGGANTAAWDGTYRSLLGKPSTSISRTNFRKYARNRVADDTRWNCYTYEAHKTLFWLFTVEYAISNCQAAYNEALTSEGYCQGGLGAGVANLDSTLWSNFNGYNPFVPCGYTNSLGNKTGIVAFEMPSEYGTLTTNVPSYRGVENPFGHLWKWTDGVNIQIQSATDGNQSRVYSCIDPANFQDSNYENYDYIGNLPRNEGYMKSILFGESGEMLPEIASGASATTYWCDYFYTNIPASGVALRGLLFGGGADYGASAGFGYAASHGTPSITGAYFGSRLCFQNESVADYCAKQFIELWFEFLFPDREITYSNWEEAL